MTDKPPIAVVDGMNRFERWADRGEVHARRLPHRSSYVAVFDAANRMIVQLRHPDKLTHPSHWDIAVAGHVEAPDYVAGPDDHLSLVYRRVAERELREELGVSGALRFATSFRPEPGVHYEHIYLYTAVCDGPFELQEEEVVAIRRLRWSEYAAWLQDDAIAKTPMLQLIIEWLVANGRWRADRD